MIIGVAVGIVIGFTLRPLIEALTSAAVRFIRDRFGGY